MTEYQYYEFQALERPLTQAQMDELAEYSSSAQISPDSFVYVCRGGDFKGDPDKWMEKYFDAFLYLAGQGARMFMLRVPKSWLSPDIVSHYCTDESLYSWSSGGHVIISFNSYEEQPERTGGHAGLNSLLPIRSDLMRGDHRALYIGWLLGVQSAEVDDDVPEPPVPPGLRSLSDSLGSLADFLRIDSDLIEAAAEHSPALKTLSLSTKQVEEWVGNLQKKEKDALLSRLIVSDDLQLAAELRERAARDMLRRGKLSFGPLRTAGKIIARSDTIAAARGRKAAEQHAILKAQIERAEAEQREKYLNSFVGSEGSLWAKVEMLVAARHPTQYEEALTILRDLHDLAHMKGKSTEFSVRMAAFCHVHDGNTDLMDRLQQADLMVENLTEELRKSVHQESEEPEKASRRRSR